MVSKSTLFGILAIIAINSQGVELTVKVHNIKKDTGRILVAVFANSENWPDGEPFLATQVETKHPETIISIDVPVGTYGLSVLQDLNDNGNMDYNAIRMPKEPWGVSNDAPARFGPPKWEKMLIEVTHDGQIAEIKLRN